jgi:two-component system, response regulator YesN
MRLLIVDDEPVIRQGLLRMAEQYEPAFTAIQTAENGAAALELIRQSQPDVVMTDIRMPRLNGIELCEILYDEYPHIMVVVISGYNEFEYAQKCIAFGVKHYLLKPADTKDFHEVLDQLIKKPNRAYIMVSRYVEWIDRMEQYIWSLQTDELNRLCVDWREYCHSAGLSLAQLKELLADCYAMLVKRMRTRGYVLQELSEPANASNIKEALEDFDASLHRMVDGLLAVRHGNIKDPMEEAKTYIDSRLSEEISLDQVAAMIGLTPTYFSALFKKMTNETFVQYRIHRRMEKAKELLAVPHLRIADVASEVGYEDYPHFTKTFKKIVGISPSEYRTGLGIK